MLMGKIQYVWGKLNLQEERDNCKSEILQCVRGEALQGTGDRIGLGCIDSSVETGEKAEGMDTESDRLEVL